MASLFAHAATLPTKAITRLVTIASERESHFWEEAHRMDIEETTHADQHRTPLSETCGGCNLTVSDAAIIADIFDGRDCNWNMTINDVLGY